MQDLAQLEQTIRYCNVCDYVLSADFGKLQYLHTQSCGIILAGGDCMHFEVDKVYCECGK